MELQDTYTWLEEVQPPTVREIDDWLRDVWKLLRIKPDKESINSAYEYRVIPSFPGDR